MKGENTVSMNTAQRQILYDALMEGTPAELAVVMADMVNKDLDAIEPHINAMLEAARQGSNPVDWSQQDAVFEFLPDGANVMVTVSVGIRKFTVHIERTRMKSLGEALIRESGL